MATLDFVGVEFVLLAIVCFILLAYFRSPEVTIDVTVSVYFSWLLGFVGILFLPYDLSVVIVENGQNGILSTVWTFIYWSTFSLAWIILPMQLDYHSSGHFTFTEKLMDAVKSQIYTGLVAVLALTLYVVYMSVTSRGAPSQVISFLMALGNTYGLLVIIFLMGSGLVGVPQRLWTISDHKLERLRLYLSARRIEASFNEARFELEDCEWQVQRAADVMARPENADMLDLKEHRLGLTDQSALALDTKHDLVDLHARLVRAQTRAAACARRWKGLLESCERVEVTTSSRSRNAFATNETVATQQAGDVEEMASLSSDDEEAAGASTEKDCPNIVCSYVCAIFLWLWGKWDRHCLRPVARTLAVVCGAFSVLILWSELACTCFPHLQSPLGLAIGAYRAHTSNSTVVVQTVVFSALAYMSICTYWALFNHSVSLGWDYAIQGPNQSPYSSLIFNGEYFSRLQFSLGWNFLLTLNAPKTHLTAFSKLMKEIALVPVFGTSFQYYVPIFLILVALLTLLNTWAHILNLFGFESDSPTGGRDCCSCWRIQSEPSQDMDDEGEGEGEGESKGSEDEQRLREFGTAWRSLSDEQRARLEDGRHLVAAELNRMASLRTRAARRKVNAAGAASHTPHDTLGAQVKTEASQLLGHHG